MLLSFLSTHFLKGRNDASFLAVRSEKGETISSVPSSSFCSFNDGCSAIVFAGIMFYNVLSVSKFFYLVL